MAIKCIAIDDEPLALELIGEFCARIPALKLSYVFEDALSGAEYLRQAEVDLLFIDINMPDITGIDLVRSLVRKPLIIFTTAHRKFAFDGFEMEAVDYLLKPIAFDRFTRAVHKAIDIIENKTGKKRALEESIAVRSEYRLVNISLPEVLYIESLEDYVRIHLKDQPPVLSLMTMKAILEKLPGEDFRRIHRKYIVPLSQVRSVLNRKLLLRSGTELPVSDTYAGFLEGPAPDA